MPAKRYYTIVNYFNFKNFPSVYSSTTNGILIAMKHVSRKHKLHYLTEKMMTLGNAIFSILILVVLVTPSLRPSWRTSSLWFYQSICSTWPYHWKCKKKLYSRIICKDTRNKIYSGIFKCKNVQVPASAKAMKQSRKQAPNFVIVNLKNQIQI